MSQSDLETIAQDILKALNRTSVRSGSVFVATSVSYPNGTGVSVRIDQGRDGFTVSDDGYAEVIAEDMGVVPALYRVASKVAERAGVTYESGSFYVTGLERSSLPTAVTTVANASAKALERTIAALEQPRLKRSREVFDKRLKEAFGDAVAFDVDFKGATGKQWEFNAGILDAGAFERLFELVSPSSQGVAFANMKIIDVRSLTEPPSITAALIDYDKTEPALRSILSNAGSLVIPASADAQKYRMLQ